MLSNTKFKLYNKEKCACIYHFILQYVIILLNIQHKMDDFYIIQANEYEI